MFNRTCFANVLIHTFIHSLIHSFIQNGYFWCTSSCVHLVYFLIFFTSQRDVHLLTVQFDHNFVQHHYLLLTNWWMQLNFFTKFLGSLVQVVLVLVLVSLLIDISDWNWLNWFIHLSFMFSQLFCAVSTLSLFLLFHSFTVSAYFFSLFVSNTMFLLTLI